MMFLDYLVNNEVITMKKTKEIQIGNVKIGNGNKIAIQSMTTTKPSDVEKTVNQIKILESAGCDIVRVTVPTIDDAKFIDKIKDKISIPLVADIHFDYKIALECIERGIDKIRINPGNIGERTRVKILAEKANLHNIPIRIGVNSGSVDKEILEKYGSPNEDAMVQSALKEVKILEQCDFTNIVLSLKASNVTTTVKAYKMISDIVSYPLHIGVTEAGSEYSGLVKSSVGLGSLIIDGIGDTMRVSLTAEPEKEIYAAKEILKACGKLDGGINIVSCPTCGRCNYNLIEIVKKVETLTKDINKNLTVAVMGCVVNGPGEAKEADLGVAGGLNECILFKKGKLVRKIPFESLLEELMKEINGA